MKRWKLAQRLNDRFAETANQILLACRGDRTWIEREKIIKGYK